MSIQLSEQEKISCKKHKNEQCIAADLNTKGKKEVNFLCVKCLIEQQSNQKIIQIEDTKRLINQMRIQKLENQSKENEARRETFKNVLLQIKEFKLQLKNFQLNRIINRSVVTLDMAFDKMASFVQQRLFYIQKDIESLQFEGKNNYLEDLTDLSRIYSEEMIDDSKKLQEDKKIIDEIQKQFESLFSTPQYLQINQTIKNTRSIINEESEGIIIIDPIKITNQKKTPSLNKTCKSHKKEIIMFEIESNRDIEERFMCVDCMKDSPKKYKTIEDLDEQWTNFNQEQDKVLQKLKKKKLDQTSKVQAQITEIRKKFNSQLNDLEDALVKEQIESNNQINQIKKINSITIYELSDEDLSEAMKILNKVEKASTVDSRLINYQNSKDQIFYQDIESRLERLKQHNILDIQQSINIINENANDDNELKQISEMVIQLIKQPQSDQQNKATLDQIYKNFNEFLRITKQYEYHIDYFNNTVKQHQDYMPNLEPFRNKLLSINHQNQNDDNDCVKLFDKHIKKLKDASAYIQQFCEVEKYREEIQAQILKTKQTEAECKIKELQEKLTDKQSDYLKILTKQIKLENLTRSLKRQRTYLIEKNSQLDQLENFLEKQNQFQLKTTQFQENLTKFIEKQSVQQEDQTKFIEKSTQFYENQIQAQTKQPQFQENQTEFIKKQSKYQEEQIQFMEKQSKLQENQTKFIEKSIKFQETLTQFQAKQTQFQQNQTKFQAKLQYNPIPQNFIINFQFQNVELELIQIKNCTLDQILNIILLIKQLDNFLKAKILIICKLDGFFV